MRQLRSFLLLLAVVITSANAAEQTKATSSPKALFQVAQSSDLFGYKLLHQLELQERSQRGNDDDPKNLLISPFSLSTALTMTMTGAQGDTYEEMRSVLRLNNSQLTEPELIAAYSRLLQRINSSPSSSTVLQLASAVALQDNYHLLPTFLDIVESDFHSKLFSVDFADKPKAAINEVNNWVGEKTNGKIPTVLFAEEQLDKDTKLVLLNALYFKGAWAEKFKKKHTTEEEFTLSEEKKFNVSMMHEELISLRQTTTEEGHQLVELPYRGEVQSMLLFLPNETFLTGNSSTTTTTITSAFYRAIKKHKALSKMRSKWVDLSLPRFKIESDSFQELKGILQKMGMRAAFEGGVADFSRGMTGGKGLKIAQVVQKTMIEVNEAGADVAAAAASPAVPFNYYSLPLPPTSMHFNRPFLFAIRDNRLYVNLFVGIVNKPEGGSEVGAKEENDDDDDGERKIFYY